MSFTEGLQDLGRTVAKFAPLLGTVIAGPGGAAVGALVAHQFGGDVNHTDELIKRINSDPEQEFKLKELETNSKIQLEQLRVQQISDQLKDQQEKIRLEVDDRKSAREYSAAQKSPTTEKIDNFQKLALTVFQMIVILSCIITVYMGRVDANEMGMIGLIVGMAIRSISKKDDYYYGADYQQKQDNAKAA